MRYRPLSEELKNELVQSRAFSPIVHSARQIFSVQKLDQVIFRSFSTLGNDLYLDL